MKSNTTIHLQGGCFRTDSIRGPYFKIQTTAEISKVTCEQCLEKINRLNLRERKEFPAIPTFQAKSNGWNWFLTCPVCGRENVHGPGSGHRASHCDCWKAGYILTPAGHTVKDIVPGPAAECVPERCKQVGA